MRRADRPEEGASRAEQTDRPTRVPLHRQNIIKANTREGYVRRMVNDVDDRVERFKLAGWTPVEGERVGDAHAADPSSVGSMTTKSVGGGTKAVLMEIPQEIYDTDQKDKQGRVDALESAMENDIKGKLGGSAFGEGIKLSRQKG
jgi:hypothetical protein